MEKSRGKIPWKNPVEKSHGKIPSIPQLDKSSAPRSFPSALVARLRAAPRTVGPRVETARQIGKAGDAQRRRSAFTMRKWGLKLWNIWRFRCRDFRNSAKMVLIEWVLMAWMDSTGGYLVPQWGYVQKIVRSSLPKRLNMTTFPVRKSSFKPVQHTSTHLCSICSPCLGDLPMWWCP